MVEVTNAMWVCLLMIMRFHSQLTWKTYRQSVIPSQLPPAQIVGPMTLIFGTVEGFGLSKLLLKNSTISSLDNSFSDSVCSIIIGNQASNLYGGPEVSMERECNIVEVFCS